MNAPAISIVIPMYNAEKYISECLDSILAQTFQDFEVIVVDDCSTDNSVDVVKSYTSRFGGRLKLTQTKKNSGAPGVPGNIGLAYSRGEYLFFMDNDDTITIDALEKLYSTAKDFDADVVTCEKFYGVPDEFWNDSRFRAQLKPYSYQSGDFVSEPTLITDDLTERVRDCYSRRFLWPLWLKIIRREFLIENDIHFADNIIQDMLATCCMMYTAKRVVRVPYVINFYRVIDDSASHTTDTGLSFFRKYVKVLLSAFRHFDNFLSGIEFFRQHPAEKYTALKTVWSELTNYVVDMYGKFFLYEFDKILREELNDGDNIAMAAFSFNAGNLLRKQFILSLEKVAALEKSERENKTYIAELEKFIAQSQQYIAELENEIRSLKGQA